MPKKNAPSSASSKIKDLEERQRLQTQLNQTTSLDLLGLGKLYRLGMRVYILLLSIAVALIFLDKSAGIQLLNAIGQIVVGALQIIGLL